MDDDKYILINVENFEIYFPLGHGQFDKDHQILGLASGAVQVFEQ